MQPEYNASEFKHRFEYRVRSHECDRQSVVHNAKFLEMLEVARIEYCRDVLHFPMDPNTFVTHHKFFFVRNAINYFSPARFDQLLTIWTRVTRIGTTSVSLQQIIDGPNGSVAEAEAVMVEVDDKTDAPHPVSNSLRALASAYEGRNF